MWVEYLCKMKYIVDKCCIKKISVIRMKFNELQVTQSRKNLGIYCRKVCLIVFN